MADVIRYLSDREKDRTRPLWERIFAEDSEQFLDYYYEVKTADNEILVLERDREILSMLQLNPYRLQLGAVQVEAAYVIAVATDSHYRHQGMMAQLLERAMRDRQAKGQPFLFLMPAAEAIYRPFGFRFIYRQQSITGVPGTLSDTENSTSWQLCPVSEDGLEAAAKLAEKLLSCRHIQVRTTRDVHYYRVLKKECQAEEGDLCWLMRDGCRAGLVAYTCEEAVEIREPLLEEPAQMWEALGECFKRFQRPLYVYGIISERELENKNWKQEPVRPVIMARALDLSSLTAGIRSACPVSLVLELEDPILPDNTGRFLWQVSETGSIFGNADENEDFCGEKMPLLRVSVDEFVQLLFPGGDPAASAALLERMAPEVQEVWKKLFLYTNVFLNEIV